MKRPAEDLSFLSDEPQENWPGAWRRLAPDVEHICNAEGGAAPVPRIPSESSAPEKIEDKRESRLGLRLLTSRSAALAAAAILIIAPVLLYLWSNSEATGTGLMVRRADGATLLIEGQRKAIHSGEKVIFGSAFQSGEEELELDDGADLHLKFRARTLVEIREGHDGTTTFALRKGEVRYGSRGQRTIAFKTSQGRYVPRGTSFTLQTNGFIDILRVESGLVTIETPRGATDSVHPGESRRVDRSGNITAVPALPAKEDGGNTATLDRDTVILKNGEVLRGVLTKLGRTYILETPVGRRTIPATQIRAIHMNTASGAGGKP